MQNQSMKKLRIFFLAAWLLGSFFSLHGADLAKYNVVWDSPSKDSLDSMPLSGRLGAGANVWVQDGAIWIYASHNGAYDEQGRLLKLGCLRITPVDFKLGEAGFRQELVLANGTITIKQGDFQAALWFAGETLVFESRSGKPLAYDVAFGTWRDKKREGILVDVFVETRQNFTEDQVQPGKNGFVWFHRNADFGIDMVEKAKKQGISLVALHDVTTRRVFGGAAVVQGGISEPVASEVQWQFWDGKAWTGRTSPQENLAIAVRLGGKWDADPKQWTDEATALLDPAARKAAQADEAKRWDEFWSRSHIAVNPTAGGADEGWLAGRNYQLFRYMLACNRGGELPLLFNGGIFTTDNKPGRIAGNSSPAAPLSAGAPSSPDFRRWLFCHFMSQNQRWLGWPTLAGGDADLLEPSLAFYRDRSSTAALRAKNNGAEGVLYPEPLDVWGLCGYAPTGTSICGAGHLHYYYSMMLENAWMALQAGDALGTSLERDLPWIEGTVLFYDSFYRAQTKKRTGSELTADGKLRIYPSQALEFGGGATDPLEVVCAMHRITAGLLALQNLPAASRERLQRIQATIPDLPIGKRQGRASLFPARSIEQEFNPWEPCEMFAAWPYRMVGVTKPETLELARDTWETIPEARTKSCKLDFSWMATVANVASLARPEEAKQRAIYKMANTVAPQARFPAFFGPGHDWLPDHNWGGSGMVGMQEMLLAPEPGPTGKLHVFPSWPKDWDVDFKLHAPGPAVVEGVLKGGKLESLKVTPESRAKDIVNWLGKETPYVPPAPGDTGFENPKPAATPLPALSQGKNVTASSQFHQPGYEVAKAVDGDPRTRWASDIAARSGWIEIDLGAEKEIARVKIDEIEWPETREFAIEVKQGDAWKEVARGATIGANKQITFAPVKARFVRLNVLKAERAININEFSVFEK
jgi:hypothetical protein